MIRATFRDLICELSDHSNLLKQSELIKYKQLEENLQKMDILVSNHKLSQSLTYYPIAPGKVLLFYTNDNKNENKKVHLCTYKAAEHKFSTHITEDELKTIIQDSNIQLVLCLKERIRSIELQKSILNFSYNDMKAALNRETYSDNYRKCEYSYNFSHDSKEAIEL